MSLEAMQSVLEHSRAEGLDRAVVMATAFYAQRDSNLAFPSNKELMRWGFSESTVQRGLRAGERLGELRRQPELERHGRRRVYLVDARAGLQLQLEVGVCETGVCETPSQTGVWTGVSTRARGRNLLTEEPTSPPGPPGGGVSLDQSSVRSLPRVSDGLARVAPARRRRRRRREPLSTSEQCPLSSLTDRVAAELHERSRAFEDQFREKIGEDRWDIWGDGVHLHGITNTDALVFGVGKAGFLCLEPRSAQLSEAVGCVVVFVLCAGVPSSVGGAR